MAADPLILAFDTSAGHCAAALLGAGAMAETRCELMQRGQAERLMPLLEALLADHQLGWGDLDAIGVGVGPGNFTGIRISVAAARGLALALEIPAIGINTFEAISLDAPRPHAAAVPGPRDSLYICAPDQPPRQMSNSEAEALGLPLLLPPPPGDLALRMARLAQQRYTSPGPAPAPLYLRAADAAPSREAPPALLP